MNGFWHIYTTVEDESTKSVSTLRDNLKREHLSKQETKSTLDTNERIPDARLMHGCCARPIAPITQQITSTNFSLACDSY